MSYSPIITIMMRAAEKAAKSVIRDFNELEHLQVKKKGPADFVTVADEKAERLIKEVLQQARPDFAFLGEESGYTKAEDGAPRWIVDPIDGTTNFLHGIPHFCSSIGLERDGEIVAGLIHDPIKQEMFWAEKGAGAFLNNRKLLVSGRNTLKESLIGTGIPFAGHGDQRKFLQEAHKIMPQIAGLRRNGAAALDLAYVAAGRFDAYWEHDLKPWDMAAGVIIVREAKGMVTDTRGGKDFLDGSILASNGKLHEDVLHVLGSAAQQAKLAAKKAS